MKKHSGIELKVVDYREHSVGLGNDAAAVAYLETRLNDGRTVFGVGMNRNIVTASLKAVVSAPTGPSSARSAKPPARRRVRAYPASAIVLRRIILKQRTRHSPQPSPSGRGSACSGTLAGR